MAFSLPSFSCAADAATAKVAKSGDSSELANFKQSLDDGRRLFQDDAGVDAGEAKLGALSPAAQDSGRWHFDLAINLMRVAFANGDANKPKAATRAARRAVAHLDLAETQFKDDPKQLSTIYELRGVISERLLDNTTVAQKYYQIAAKFDPENQSAAEQARRCDSTVQSGDTPATVSTTPATTTPTTTTPSN